MDEEFIVRLELDVRNAVASARALANAISQVNTNLDSPLLQRAEKNLAEYAATSKRAAARVTTLNGEVYKNNRALEKTSKQTALYNQYLYDQKKGLEATHQSLATTRYALYSVGAALTVVSAALLAIPVAATATAIAFERSFANVKRTVNDLGSGGLQNLRNQLIELSRELPVAFNDLTEISTLGGQLNIPGKDIAAFTEVVAKLTATTNLSSEAAGTALGRFQLLFQLSGKEFDNVASSILAVGVNSVATETQVVNIATQIASMGRFAHFSAAEVIGLAGALGSIGAAPELSRGTITRLFSLFSKAVSAGSADLEGFARVAGVTSQQFADAFKGKGDFSEVFTGFIEGLARIQKDGGNVVATLNELGISSVRDVPLLQRLAGAGNLVRQSFNTSITAYETATELNKQYGIISETTAAKITKLANSVQAFLDELGSNATGPLSDFVDFLADIVKNLTNFIASDVGQRVAVIVAVFSALLGVVAAVGAAVAVTAASVIAMKIAFLGMDTVLPAFNIQMLTATGETVSFSAAANVASISAGKLGIALKVLSGALKILSVIGVAVVLPDIFRGLSDFANDAQGLDTTLNGLKDSVKNAFGGDFGAKFLSGLASPELDRALAPTILGANNLGIQLALLDEEIAKLAGTNPKQAAAELASLRTQFIAAGGNIATFKAYFPDTLKALEETATQTGLSAAALEQLAQQEEDAANHAAGLADALGLSAEGLDDYKKAIDAIATSTVDLGHILEATSKNGEASISKFNKLLKEQLKATGDIQKNLLILAANGVDSGVIQQFAELAAKSPEGAQLLQQTIDDLDGQGATLIARLQKLGELSGGALADGFIETQALVAQAFAQGGVEAATALLDALESGDPAKIQAAIDKYNLVLENNPVIIQVTAKKGLKQAQFDIDDFIVKNEKRKIGLYFTTHGGGGGDGRAAGGYMRGPGTGTSDSIPAWLSNGEYVIRASSVRRYGQGFFDALNRGSARFAGGGKVGHYAGGGAVSSGVAGAVRLDSYSLKMIARMGVTVVMPDGKVLASTVNGVNAASNTRGRG